MQDGKMPPPSGLGAPGWPLGTYLLLALLLRLPAVLFARGYGYDDQQFQSVDPAWHLATGQAWHPTWEWIDGIRSWVYPHALAAVFRVGMALGLEQPCALMTFARGVHAGVSLLPLLLLWLLVMRWRPVPSPRPVLMLAAVSGLFLVTGVQPAASGVAATFAVAAAIAVAGPGTRWPALGGLLLGLAFTCRFQDALFGPALLGVLLWQHRWRAAAAFSLACVPGIVLQGCVDLATTGAFLSSPFGYVYENVFLGAAAKWTSRPVDYYWRFVAVFVVLVPGLLRIAWRRLCLGGRIAPAVLVAGLWHLVLHSFVARKSLRFEHPAFMMMVIVVGLGIGADLTRGRAAMWHHRLLWLVHGVLWVYASLWFANAGPVRAAAAIGADPRFDGRMWVVGGSETDSGGYCYLARPQIDVVGVPREQFVQQARSEPPQPGTFVLIVRADLTMEEAAQLPGLERVGAYAGQFDLRSGERRFVYRWR